MKSFAELKKNRGVSGISALTDKLTSTVNTKNYNDDRYWKPTLDQNKNGYAVVRFLPAAPGEDVPFVQLYSHAFQGPTGKWYIEDSLTSIGQKDPVSEYNSVLWNSGIEANKDLARKQKRKLYYVSNILVISDKQNPEAEGKVFLFKYGKSIFSKVVEATNPDNTGIDPKDPLYREKCNPFDFWEGANFLLRIRQEDGYPNYDKSMFASPAPVGFPGVVDPTNDASLEALWKKTHSLNELMNPKNFKSYTQLEDRFKLVMASSVSVGDQRKAGKAVVKTVADEDDDPPFVESTALSALSVDEDDNEDLSFLKNITE